MCILDKNYKPSKLSHINDKERKEFILDMLFIGAGVSCLYVALNEDFSEGVKSIHKNKHRKNIAKIKNAYDKLDNKRKEIMSRTDLRDLKALDFKTKALGTAFINNISTVDSEVSLEYIAISILELGLTRKRKYPMKKELSLFCDYSLLYKEVGLNVEKSGIEFNLEFELAQKFINDVRY